jgi:hypothetical protein
VAVTFADMTLRRIISYFYLYFLKYDHLTDAHNRCHAPIYLLIRSLVQVVKLSFALNLHDILNCYFQHIRDSFATFVKCTYYLLILQARRSRVRNPIR